MSHPQRNAPAPDEAPAGDGCGAGGALRVLIVEDDALLRSALVGALASDRIEIVGNCSTAAEAITIARRKRPAVLVTDLDLGARPNGIELAHVLRRTDPSLAIVLLTSYADPRLVDAKLAQLPEGAEYVVKQSVENLDAIAAAIGRAVAQMRVVDRPGSAPNPSAVALTDTQLETLRLVAEGLTNEQIAAERVVTRKSVEVSIARLARELDLPAGRAGNQRVLLTRAYYELSGQPPRAPHPAP
ncbi:MAG: response regulator transcription factor [Thermoleophilia bacterium]